MNLHELLDNEKSAKHFLSYEEWKEAFPKGTMFHRYENIERAVPPKQGNGLNGMSGSWDHTKKRGSVFNYVHPKK